jgi:hypothetical protein
MCDLAFNRHYNGIFRATALQYATCEFLFTRLKPAIDHGMKRHCHKILPKIVHSVRILDLPGPVRPVSSSYFLSFNGHSGQQFE